jgi:hypothetical protein
MQFRGKLGNSNDSPTRTDMVGSTPKQKAKLKLFHVMLVGSSEEWFVEAASPEEARALLSKGEGRRCRPGDCFRAQTGHLQKDK